MKKYKIRFNLGRGENYKKWQVKNMITKEVNHYNPMQYNLLLFNSILTNKKKSSIKIYNGANKFPCAWIECENYIVTNKELIKYENLSYNPRIKPFWVNGEGINIDDSRYYLLITSENKIYKGCE